MAAAPIPAVNKLAPLVDPDFVEVADVLEEEEVIVEVSKDVETLEEEDLLREVLESGEEEVEAELEDVEEEEEDTTVELEVVVTTDVEEEEEEEEVTLELEASVAPGSTVSVIECALKYEDIIGSILEEYHGNNSIAVVT